MAKIKENSKNFAYILGNPKEIQTNDKKTPQKMRQKTKINLNIE